MKKGISIILIFIICFSFQGCIVKPVSKNILSMGIRVNMPKSMIFGYSESKVFKYNNISVSTVNIQAVNKVQSISFKTFPFSINDYKTHFKSAFDGENIKSVKYDYEEVKPFGSIDKIYKSKAILVDKKTNKEQYSYVYLLSFKNRSGTLILETVSNIDQDFMSVVESIAPISVDLKKIEYKEQKPLSEQTKKVNIFNGIFLDMPSSYKVTKVDKEKAYYINGFGKDRMEYVSISKNIPQETNNLFWSNINGYEVLKKFDDNNYLVSDLNNQKIYYLNTKVSAVTDNKGEKYFMRVEQLWK